MKYIDWDCAIKAILGTVGIWTYFGLMIFAAKYNIGWLSFLILAPPVIVIFFVIFPLALYSLCQIHKENR